MSAEARVECEGDEERWCGEPDDVCHAVLSVDVWSGFGAEDGAEHSCADEESDGLGAAVVEERSADLSGLCGGDGVVHARADDADDLEDDELPEGLGEPDGADGEGADEDADGRGDAGVVVVGEPCEEGLE